jgi:hypothetical protein
MWARCTCTAAQLVALAAQACSLLCGRAAASHWLLRPALGGPVRRVPSTGRLSPRHLATSAREYGAAKSRRSTPPADRPCRGSQRQRTEMGPPPPRARRARHRQGGRTGVRRARVAGWLSLLRIPRHQHAVQPWVQQHSARLLVAVHAGLYCY